MSTRIPLLPIAPKITVLSAVITYEDGQMTDADVSSSVVGINGEELQGRDHMFVVYKALKTMAETFEGELKND